MLSACCVIFSSLWVEALGSKDTLSPGKKILTPLTIYGSDMNLSYLTQLKLKEIYVENSTYFSFAITLCRDFRSFTLKVVEL